MGGLGIVGATAILNNGTVDEAPPSESTCDSVLFILINAAGDASGVEIVLETAVALFGNGLTVKMGPPPIEEEPEPSVILPAILAWDLEACGFLFILFIP